MVHIEADMIFALFLTTFLPSSVSLRCFGLRCYKTYPGRPLQIVRCKGSCVTIHPESFEPWYGCAIPRHKTGCFNEDGFLKCYCNHNLCNKTPESNLIWNTTDYSVKVYPVC